eukprot:1798626-Rhodomonas_salina.5
MSKRDILVKRSSSRLHQTLSDREIPAKRSSSRLRQINCRPRASARVDATRDVFRKVSAWGR